MTGEATRPAERYAFRCSACGQCCNSPPAMTLEELFHHERRFIGCLTVRRVAEPLQEGAQVDGLPVSAATAAEWRALHEALVGSGEGRSLRVAARAYDYPSLGRCPALQDDGRCAIHDDRKPGMCGVVPLEPELPDGMQRVVLFRRAREAAFLGAACIAPAGPQADAVAAERVVDAGLAGAIARQRAALAEDARAWGRPLAAALGPGLGSTRRAALPSGAHLTLSLVPVLDWLSSRSAETRRRCVDYARAQAELIEASIESARSRRNKADRPFTEELRRFRTQYRDFVAGSERVDPASAT